MADRREWWKSPTYLMLLGIAMVLIGLIRWVAGYGTWPWLQVAAGVLMVVFSIQEFRRQE